MRSDQSFLAALLSNTSITEKHGLTNGNPSIFTRRPAPGEAEYPMTIISKPVGQFNQDYLVSEIGMHMRQISTYGLNPDKERIVEQIADEIRAMFHDIRTAITIPNYHVISLEITGPVDAPTSDEKITGMMCVAAVKTQRLS